MNQDKKENQTQQGARERMRCDFCRRWIYPEEEIGFWGRRLLLGEEILLCSNCWMLLADIPAEDIKLKK